MVTALRTPTVGHLEPFVICREERTMERKWECVVVGPDMDITRWSALVSEIIIGRKKYKARMRNKEEKKKKVRNKGG